MRSKWNFGMDCEGDRVHSQAYDSLYLSNDISTYLHKIDCLFHHLHNPCQHSIYFSLSYPRCQKWWSESIPKANFQWPKHTLHSTGRVSFSTGSEMFQKKMEFKCFFYIYIYIPDISALCIKLKYIWNIEHWYKDGCAYFQKVKRVHSKWRNPFIAAH